VLIDPFTTISAWPPETGAPPVFKILVGVVLNAWTPLVPEASEQESELYPFYHEDPMPRQYNKIKMFPQELRWFEIWIEFDKINIIKEICIKTRMQDEFTHVVANGYANICKRKWKGTKSED
jgi:hypothetical protein